VGKQLDLGCASFALALGAAAVTTISDFIPDFLPFFSPGKGALALLADLAGQVLFFDFVHSAVEEKLLFDPLQLAQSV
jgi:hypothetical protein